MSKVWIMQEYVEINGNRPKTPPSRPRVFFGENAEIDSNDYIERWCRTNGFKEVESGDFNERLFKRQFPGGKAEMYQELVELKSEHFVHDCT